MPNASTAILTCSWREAQAGRALAFNIDKGVAKQSRIKLSKPRTVVASFSGNLIATHDRHTILVWASDSFGTTRPLALHHTKGITCVAISPDGAKIAAGDVTGRIMIWHDVADTIASRAVELEDREDEDEAMDLVEPPAATVHWHAHAVGAVVFSIDGTYLLSGGQEAVLVIWDVISGRRAYLPRLGGALTAIAACPSDPARFSIGQSDNTLRVLNTAAMTVDASIHGIRPLPSPSSSFVVIQPKSGLAVVAGPHAMLQWYDLLRDSHVDKLQLSQRNIVSLTEKDAIALGGPYGPPVEPAATLVAFSPDAGVMATVETRPDAAGGGAVQYILKFWDKTPSTEASYGSPYTLNSVADQPHRSSIGFGAVTALALAPTPPGSAVAHLAATTSDVGEFKIWTRQSTTHSGSNGSGKTTTWRCGAVGSLRDEPLTACAFSPDGSILAVGSVFGTISLWNAVETSLLGVLPLPYKPQLDGMAAIQQLAFIAKTPLLIARLSGGLAVYNLLTMRCEWSAEMGGVVSVTTDPSSPHWAAVLASVNKHHDQGIVVFKGVSSMMKPVAAFRVKTQMKGDKASSPPTTCCCTSFIPPHTSLYTAAMDAGGTLPGASPLVVLTSQRTYAVVVDRDDDNGNSTSTGNGHIGGASRLPQSRLQKDPKGALGVGGYEAIFGASPQAKTKEGGGDVAAAAAAVATTPWSSLFDVPSHALPPMGTLCPAFLELMISSSGTGSGTDDGTGL